MRIPASFDILLDVLNLVDGVFAPLRGFMVERDYRSVVERMRLASGEPWSLPITFAVSPDRLEEARRADVVEIVAPDGIEGVHVGETIACIGVESLFEVCPGDCLKVFGTDSSDHPGVAWEEGRGRWRIGGPVSVEPGAFIARNPHFLPPARVREEIARRGWKTVVGFQTRNAIHRAHEHLQRIALEIADGLFIQPLTGWKKEGDAATGEIVAAYGVMLESFYPRDRVLFSVLETHMRYAGPREAIFHAIVRRNFGCTHFIVGRDHAGVGTYYGKYEAQRVCASFHDLGIEILPLAGPFHCDRCGGVVTERTCSHATREPSAVREISGTMIRTFLSRGEPPPAFAMRPEVARVILESRRHAGDVR